MKNLSREEKVALGRKEYLKRYYQAHKEHLRELNRKSKERMYLRVYEEMTHEQPEQPEQ